MFEQSQGYALVPPVTVHGVAPPCQVADLRIDRNDVLVLLDCYGQVKADVATMALDLSKETKQIRAQFLRAIALCEVLPVSIDVDDSLHFIEVVQSICLDERESKS